MARNDNADNASGTELSLTPGGPTLHLVLSLPTPTEHAFTVWRSARLAAAILSHGGTAAPPSTRPRRSFQLPPRCRLLELGSGCGALALHLAASSGAHVTATERPHAVPALAANLARNGPLLAASGGSATAAAYEWGSAPAPLFPRGAPPPQLLLGTDLVLGAYAGAALARSLAALALVAELLAAQSAATAASAAASAPPPPAWPPRWRPRACRILMLNQLRERAVQAEFERAAARLLALRRGGGGGLLVAARAGGDEFILYRARVRRDVCLADAGLARADAADCGLLVGALAHRLYCRACLFGGDATAAAAAPAEAAADDGRQHAPFCFVCGAGRPATAQPPPFSAPPPPPRGVLVRQYSNPLSPCSLAAAGLAGIDVQLAAP